MKLLKGYNLVISSWENDGDHRDTKVFVTQDKNEVKFILDFLPMFYSNEEGFGNTDAEISGTLGNRFKEVLSKYNMSGDYYDYEDEDGLDSVLFELLYRTIGSSSYSDYHRVFDNVIVYYLEEDLKPLSIEDL